MPARPRPAAEPSARETPKPSKPAAKNKRGSPEAVAKRRLARKLNRLLTEGSATAAGDGRTERRRRRLLKELEQGTRDPATGLKPVEVLQRVHELLELGETPAALRKVVKPHPRPAVDVDEARALLREIHAAYGFREEAYAFIGLPDEALDALRPATEPTKPRKRKSP
ncbi:MAG: hypothetical protein R3A52_05975 [Polyangiales bacterium]